MITFLMRFVVLLLFAFIGWQGLDSSIDGGMPPFYSAVFFIACGAIITRASPPIQRPTTPERRRDSRHTINKDQLEEVIDTFTLRELIWILSEMHNTKPLDQEGLEIARDVIDSKKDEHLKLN